MTLIMNLVCNSKPENSNKVQQVSSRDCTSRIRATIREQRPSNFVSLAAASVSNGVKVATVCGFPSGKHEAEIKAAEAKLSVSQGAHEVGACGHGARLSAIGFWGRGFGVRLLACWYRSRRATAGLGHLRPRFGISGGTRRDGPHPTLRDQGVRCGRLAWRGSTHRA